MLNSLILGLVTAHHITGSVLSRAENLLLDDVQHRAVRFFVEQSHPVSGLSKDRASNYKDSDTYTVASCASTGFALAAYAIGVEHKWLTREDALTRTKRSIRGTLELNEHDHGWLYHFTDWSTGKRMWNCEASSIDTSIFVAGLIAAEQYWKDPEVSSLAHKFIARIDWKWMLTDGGAKPGELHFSMGWKPEDGFIKSRWDNYNELLMLYIQGYGADARISAGGWDTIGRPVISDQGPKFLTGGPLFMHQMSNGFIDTSERRDRNGFSYWVSTRNATRANRQYGIKDPKRFGYNSGFWGLSACDGPDGYSAFGTPPDDSDNGTITPTSVLASLEYTPKESMEFFSRIRAEQPEAYGRYGFSNGINRSRHWVGPDVIGIDLGMMLVGVENARSGLIHRLSMRSSLIQRGLARAGLKVVPGSNTGPLRSG